MIIEKLVQVLPVKSRPAKLIFGSVVAALSVSLGTVGALRLLGLSADPVVPSVLASVAAALYAARARR